MKTTLVGALGLLMFVAGYRLRMGVTSGSADTPSVGGSTGRSAPWCRSPRRDSSHMSYKSRTIQQAIEDIDHNKLYLPALQRKFVWGKHQIQLLFDSLMRNYPIGTFLLEIEQEKGG